MCFTKIEVSFDCSEVRNFTWWRHYDVIYLICINFLQFWKDNEKLFKHAKFQIHIFWNDWVIGGG